jgi:amphi-Trp domain-containing protein
MGEETLFTYERSRTRGEVAAALRAVAGQLSGTEPLTLTADEDSVTVHPADSLEFEVEVEREDADGKDAVELEFELEWTEAATAERPQSTDAPQTTDTADAPGTSDAAEREAERATVDLESSEPPEGEEDVAGSAGSQATFEVFRDRADEWRWRLVHRNGNVIATSGEGYTTRRNAERGLRSVVENAPAADVVDGL